MKRQITRLCICVLLLFLFSCNANEQVKFKKAEWREQSDPLFPSIYRKKMLKDLTTNYKLIGMTYSQLVRLLGEPDYRSDSTLSYKITVDYGHDIDPVYTKDLDFVYTKDSTIKSWKLNEWKKH